METTVQPKRKIIDLDGNTFRALSVMAANKGVNLKKLIETMLYNIAEQYDDNQQYAWLLEHFPEGKQMVSKQEEKEFENWLGV